MFGNINVNNGPTNYGHPLFLYLQSAQEGFLVK